MGKSVKQPAPPDYVGQARAQGEANIAAAREQARLDRFGQTNPYGTRTWSQDANGNWSMTDGQTANQATLQNQRETRQIGINDVAASRLPQLEQLGTPMDTSGLPARQTSVNAQPLNTTVGPNDYSADRQQVIDALMRQQTSMLDPQFQQQEDAMRTRLLNSGIREGTEAWNRSWDDFGRTRTAAYGDARDRAIVAGGQEQSRLLADELAGRGFENTAIGQKFGIDMANAGLNNSQRDAQLSEDATVRQRSLEEILSLFGMTGGENSAGFLNPGGTQSITPTDITGATNAQYQAQVGAANQRQAANNANTQALTQLASAGLTAWLGSLGAAGAGSSAAGAATAFF